MANILRPNFRWCGTIAGGTNGNPTRVRGRVADDYATALFIGAPVKLVSTGTFDLSAAGEAVWGVIEGIEPSYSTAEGRMKYENTLPAATSYDTNFERESRLIIIPAKGNLFKIACDDAVSATTYAAYRTLIGNNGDHAIASGAALFDISNAVATTTGTAQWRIWDIPNPDFQDYASNYVELIVTVNEDQSNSTTGV